MKTLSKGILGLFVGLALLLNPVTGYRTARMEEPPPIKNLEDLFKALGGDSKLQLLSGEYINLDYAVKAGNCASMVGQWDISGATGGFTVDAQQLSSAAWGIPSKVVSTLGFTTKVNSPVFILIVDDFNGIDAYLDAKPDSFNSQFMKDIQTIVNDPSLKISEKDYRLQTTIPHGALVRYHTYEVMAGLDAKQAAVLTVVPVDVGHYDTQTIAAHIGDAIAEIQKSSESARFVVNMSFAVIPCVISGDYAAVYKDNPDFNHYVENLMADNPALSSDLNLLEKDLRDILAAPIGDVNGDPLARMMQDPPSTIKYVASAGNFGLPYPFYPAAWPFVESVGAIDLLTQQPWQFSNQAAVYQPGVWFQLEDLASGTGPLEVYYVGTSFAAPVESVNQALQMSQ